MNLRFPIGLAVAASVVFGAAMSKSSADPLPAGSSSDPTRPSSGASAATAARVSPGTARPSAAGRADRILAARSGARSRSAPRRLLASSKREPSLAAPEQAVRVVGQCETGNAAWYGGYYVGRRTSNGERLDSINPTAAHRTLPLNSLARVTNLKNGRSVIVRVTDRGPVSDSLVIDVSPKAADQLDMKAAGIARVMVEQVVALTVADR
jgi:rare lipoprotein A